MFLASIDVGALSSDDPMQSDFWASLKGKHGWKPSAYHLGHSTLLVLSKTFFHCLTLAYVPFGPKEDVGVLELSRALYHFLPRNTFAIRYDLPWNSQVLADGAVIQTESVQPDATVIIDLTPGYYAVSKAYHERAKRAIKKSKQFITIREGDGSEADLNRFYTLYEETGKRDGFAIRSKDYIHDVLTLKGRETESRLFLAERNGETVGGTILLYSPKKAIYLFGASKRMDDCTASHALQDAMIHFAVDHGCQSYDLFGVSSSDGRGSHLATLDLFKTSFGGQRIERKPTMDVPRYRFVYELFTMLESDRYKRARTH